MRRITKASLRALCSALLAASVLTGPAVLAGDLSDGVAQVDQEAGDRLAAIESLLKPAETITTALPDDPQQALIDATSELSADLGFPQDPTSAVLLARLPDEIAGRIANVLADMGECNAITQAHFEAIAGDLERIAADGGGLDPARFGDIRSCALRLWKSTSELELTLAETRNHPVVLGCTPTPHDDPKPPPLQEEIQQGLRTASTIDVWPVLRFDGLCASNTYANDYLLTVDMGGGDTYANNAGSNMIDLNYSPATSNVRGLRDVGPARGCQQAIAGLRQADCTPAVAVVLDVRGTDTYGVLQSPDLDLKCTPATSQLIRRMVTGGVGFLGVGILRDAGDGWDRYTSKTVSLGAGHIFGVGVLSDEGGNDSYLSVRNSQGFALVGGVGVLADESGNDTYDYYMPPAINPALPNQTDGAGGVVDDESRQAGGVDFEGQCDRIPRFTQGTGNVTTASLGILVDFAGSDRYRGAYGPFTAPGQVPPEVSAVEGHIGGSMGFGANGGAGLFVDFGSGFDTYTTVDYPLGAAPRGNNRVIAPRSKATGNGGLGLFVDE